jgi:hypothetical protein
MIDSAVRVGVNCVTALILLMIFFIVICSVSCTVRAAGNNPKRPIDPQILNFVLAVVKAVLWLAFVPYLFGPPNPWTAAHPVGTADPPAPPRCRDRILIMRIGIAADSLVGVVTSITLSVAMSVRPLVENFVAGAAILAEQVYKTGDVVQLMSRNGVVKEVRLGLTVITEPDGKETYLPNSKVLAAPMVTLKERVRVDVDFEIVPDVSMSAVRDALMGGVALTAGGAESGLTHHAHRPTAMLPALALTAGAGVGGAGDKPIVLDEPPPVVIVKDITQTALEVAIRVWVMPSNYLRASGVLREKCRESLIASGVPLAQWRSHVAGTIHALGSAGYPGLEKPRRKSHKLADTSASTRDVDEDMAIAAVAIM